MASGNELGPWEVGIDHEAEAWDLAKYSWDPVGLVASRKPEAAAADSRQEQVCNSGNDSGGSTQDYELQAEAADPPCGGVPPAEPIQFHGAPVYIPPPTGSKKLTCQVAGCGLRLDGMKGYFLRHRLCEEHSKAPVLLVADVPSRLCQQCSKFHHVSAFEGSKRTCIMQLDRIRVNKRLRRSRKLNEAAVAALAATSADATADLDDQPLQSGTRSHARRPMGRPAKRPAERPVSGEGSWGDSRKAPHMSGKEKGAEGGGDGCGGRGGEVGVSTHTAAATLSGLQVLAALHEAGGSGSGSEGGSQDHSGAIFASSKCFQTGTQCVVPTPLSLPHLPDEMLVTGPDSGENRMHGSPASAVTGDSVGGLRDRSGFFKGTELPFSSSRNQIQQQHPMQQHAHGRMQYTSSSDGNMGLSCGQDSTPCTAAACPLVIQPGPVGSLQAPLLMQGVPVMAAPQHGQHASAPGGDCAQPCGDLGAVVSQPCHSESLAERASVSSLHPVLHEQLQRGLLLQRQQETLHMQKKLQALAQQQQQQGQQQQQELAWHSDPYSDFLIRGSMQQQQLLLQTGHAMHGMGLAPLVPAAQLQQHAYWSSACQLPTAWGAPYCNSLLPQCGLSDPYSRTSTSAAAASTIRLPSMQVLTAASASAASTVQGAATTTTTTTMTTLSEATAIAPAAGLQASAPSLPPPMTRSITPVSVDSNDSGGAAGPAQPEGPITAPAPATATATTTHGSSSLLGPLMVPEDDSCLDDADAGALLDSLLELLHAQGAADLPPLGHLEHQHSDAGAPGTELAEPRSGSTGGGLPQHQPQQHGFTLLGCGRSSTAKHVGPGAAPLSLGVGVESLQARAAPGCMQQLQLLQQQQAQQVPHAHGGVLAVGPHAFSCGDLGTHSHMLLMQQQQQQHECMQQQQRARVVQQYFYQQQQHGLLHLQQAQALAQPSVPVAGRLLSRLVDTDTTMHHMSTAYDHHGSPLEQQLLRRQLLSTLSPGPASAAQQLAASATAAAAVPGPACAAACAGPFIAPGAPPQPAWNHGSPPQPHSQWPNWVGGNAMAMPHSLSQGSGGAFSGASAGAVAAGRLLGPSVRPSPAAQLQALEQARGLAVSGAAAAAAGLGNSSGDSSSSSGCFYASIASAPLGGGAGATACHGIPDLLTRVSLKFMDCMPEELPADIRVRVQAFASQAPVDFLQGCLRPGCTELVLDAVLAGGADEQAAVAQLLFRSGDVLAAAAALQQALPPSLRGQEVWLQAADRALRLRPGAAPQKVAWADVGMWAGGLRAAQPEILATKPLVVCREHADPEDESNSVRLRVYGRHLTDPRVTLLARMGGRALSVSITPIRTSSNATAITTISETASQPTAPAASTAAISSSCRSIPHPSTGEQDPPYEEYDIEVQLPYNAPLQGLLLLEPRAGALLGPWLPVLLLEQAGAAAEVEALLLPGLSGSDVRRLIAGLGLFVDLAERCGAAAGAGAAGTAGSDCEGEAKSHASRRSPAHSRIVQLGGTLLALSAQRGCPHLMSYLGSHLVELGQPLAALPRVSYNSLPLLACALLSGCGPALRIAAEWAARSGAAVDWRAQVPGQPPGCSLLHVAAALPPRQAAIAVRVLWALARAGPQQQPAHADAFAAAWFDDSAASSAGLDAPAVLFRTAAAAAVTELADLASSSACLNRAECSGRSDEVDGDVTDAALSASIAVLELAGMLDRICLMRLASSYIRSHSFTSPLDHVQLPSCSEASSAVQLGTVVHLGSSSAGSSGGAGDGGDDGVAVSTAAPHHSDGGGDDEDDYGCSVSPRELPPHTRMGGHSQQQRQRHERQQRQWPLPQEWRSCEAAPAGARLPTGAPVGSVSSSSAQPFMQGQGEWQRQGQRRPLEAPPQHMRVTVAPRALQQHTAAASAAASAAAASDGATAAADVAPDAQLASRPSAAAADPSLASCSTALTAATSATLCSSGSMPAFGSSGTATGAFGFSSLDPSSLYTEGGRARQSSAAAKPPLPLHPLLNMARPLPGSSSAESLAPAAASSGCVAAAAAAAGTAGERGGQPPAAATLAHAPPAFAVGGRGGATASSTSRSGDRNAGLPVEGPQQQTQTLPPPQLQRPQPQEAAAASGNGVGCVADREAGRELGREAEKAAAEPRGHMRGLTRMFKRLFSRSAETGAVQ